MHPLLVIEILSRGRQLLRAGGAMPRLSGGWGTETIWIIDPQTRSGKMCLGRIGWVAERLTVAGT